MNRIKIVKVKKFEDNRGKVIKMLNKKDKLFSKFGEIYFTTIKPRKIKAWRMHTKNICHLLVIKGKIVLKILHKNKVKNIKLSEHNNFLVKIPNNYWFGMKNLGKTEVIVANLMDDVHTETEVKRLEHNYFKKINWQ